MMTQSRPARGAMMRAAKLLTILTLVSIAAIFIDGKPFRPDYTYVSKAGGWFKLHAIPANWEDARLRCFFEGAVLVSPLNKGIIKGIENITTLSYPIYIGVHSTDSPGDYKSIEGVSVADMPVKWLLDEPNNKENQEHCAVYHTNNEVADVNCADVHPFVCYREGPSDMELTECETIDKEYKLDKRTGNCYKFHRVGMTWMRAMMACAAEGGYLAIINSDAEADVIKDLFIQNPNNTITALDTDEALIGFYDWMESGIWGTVHGQSLQNAGYAKWSENEPSIHSVNGHRQACGAVFRTGLLDNQFCDANQAFICEKEVGNFSDLTFDVRGSWGSPQFRSDYKHNPEAEGWFKLHTIPATWEDARLRCFFEGAVLASPLNSEIEAGMKKMAESNQFPVFIGVHAANSFGDFYSIEGVPLAEMPVKWLLNEPNNENDAEDCLAYYDNGEMADISCNRVLPYMCYRKETKDMVMTECGTIDKEYKLDNRTGSCYKFHRAGSTWSRALLACAAEGGRLAVLNSIAEADVLTELFLQNPEDCITATFKGGARLGFYDWGESGQYGTIEGQTLEEAGYAKWAPGQPDTVWTTVDNRTQHCGGMFPNGLLDNVFCHFNMAFICEKDPTSLQEPTFDVRTSIGLR